MFEYSREYQKTRVFPWRKVCRTKQKTSSTMQKMLQNGYFFNVVLVFLEQPKRSGRKQTTSMSSLINKKVRANDVSLPKPYPQILSPPVSDLEQSIKLISSKLDEGNVKGGIRLASSDDKMVPFSTDNYQKLLSKHPQRAEFAASNPKNLDSFL